MGDGTRRTMVMCEGRKRQESLTADRNVKNGGREATDDFLG